MPFPIPEFRPQRTPEPPAMVSYVARSDVTWNRPLFKAPPLVIDPQKFDTKSIAEDVRRASRNAR